MSIQEWTEICRAAARAGLLVGESNMKRKPQIIETPASIVRDVLRAMGRVRQGQIMAYRRVAAAMAARVAAGIGE